ncbi:hypothetical protein FRB90_011018, partial [Tulasnella sp. 427]
LHPQNPGRTSSTRLVKPLARLFSRVIGRTMPPEEATNSAQTNGRARSGWSVSSLAVGSSGECLRLVPARRSI